MKIALLEAFSSSRRYISKDTQGGFGTRTSVGNSIRARVLEIVKQKGVKIPIMSLGYISGIFRKYGHQVVVNKVDDADLVIIPSSIVDYKHEIATARQIKDLTKAKVGFIGPFATVKPEIFLQMADFVIGGEPEAVATKIAEKNEIPDGYIKGEIIENLDTIPFPNWDGFDINSYSYFPSIKVKPFLTIQSSRGCPLPCNYYCPYPLVQGKKLRKRSVNNVMEEILYLKNIYNVKGLMFRDPVFTLDKERTKEIARGIKGLGIEWGCETHIDFLDEELVRIMYESGLKTIEVGIESANKNLLKSIHRGGNYLNRREGVVRYCENLGIRISAFYILGLPEDTRESIGETIRYAKSLNTSAAQFTILTPYPGTEFFKEVEKDIATREWERFDGYTPVLNYKNISKDELLSLKERAFLEYYYRPGWLLKLLR